MSDETHDGPSQTNDESISSYKGYHLSYLSHSLSISRTIPLFSVSESASHVDLIEWSGMAWRGFFDDNTIITYARALCFHVTLFQKIT